MPPDGRLAKGAVRRRSLLDATLRLVGRTGVAAVTQRAVAAEAGVPPSAVLYYFDSVDSLLVTALREVNDRYCADWRASPRSRTSRPISVGTPRRIAIW